ncbi:CMP-sialic acid transporter 3 [Artemisia annua]|uniref:CMP-sialic acid transporter 3 n=1 Tax=Artemisia annua TaxID=35608 RepID=A0A2U1MJI3_ARTAN|nr:CMP-sialic acid transporter 3 [Artemisia annua]
MDDEGMMIGLEVSKTALGKGDDGDGKRGNDYRATISAPRNNVLFAVPAFLYAINNYLKFTMQLYFNPAMVKMLSNLKEDIDSVRYHK